MDDPSISDNGRWLKERYDDILGKLTPFLKGCGYHPTRDLAFCPLAALTGGNVQARVPPCLRIARPRLLVLASRAFLRPFAKGTGSWRVLGWAGRRSCALALARPLASPSPLLSSS